MKKNNHECQLSVVWLGNLDKVQSDTWLVWAWYQVMLANGDWTSHGTSKLSRVWYKFRREC